MSDSWIARKLEAQLAGRYLMSSVLITSTMKSEPGTPPTRGRSFGVEVSAAATAAVGGSAEGRGVAASAVGASAARATGVMAVAAPAATTPVRNLRRSGLRAMGFSSSSMRDTKSKIGVRALIDPRETTDEMADRGCAARPVRLRQQY